MFEESAENFTARWKNDAAAVQIFPRVENDPLLEFEAGGVILQALERTGPYLAHAGPGRAVIHALTELVEPDDRSQAGVEMTGISRGRFHGRIIRREPGFLVVDVGFSLVTGVLQEPPESLQAGDMVRFEALPPLHAFVLVDSVQQSHDFEV